MAWIDMFLLPSLIDLTDSDRDGASVCKYS